MTGLIEHVIAAVRPTTVYVHSGADGHQDHRAVHEATAIAARRVQQVFCYQSPSSRNGFSPTKFVPVDDTIAAKVRVLASYRSQATRHYLEPDLVVATARYWARQLPHARYAEPFEVIRACDAAPRERRAPRRDTDLPTRPQEGPPALDFTCERRPVRWRRLRLEPFRCVDGASRRSWHARR